MATVLHDDLDLCVVCTHLVANGEYVDGTDAADECSRAQVEKWGRLAVHMVLTDGEDEYSTLACDGCGDTDHGYRHKACIIATGFEACLEPGDHVAEVVWVPDDCYAWSGHYECAAHAAMREED